MNDFICRKSDKPVAYSSYRWEKCLILLQKQFRLKKQHFAEYLVNMRKLIIQPIALLQTFNIQ